jgi:hypothetical protein
VVVVVVVVVVLVVVVVVVMYNIFAITRNKIIGLTRNRFVTSENVPARSSRDNMRFIFGLLSVFPLPK